MDNSLREQGTGTEGDPDGQQVLEQLERLLADSTFSTSKRYPRFLKYVVEETVAGRVEHLKERTLGVEVFGRDAAYDTNQDPVVRTSAAQVRQRLAQYYQDPAHQSELRIEMLPGSYVPQFRRADVAEPEAAAMPVVLELRRRSRWPFLLGAAALIGIVCLLIARWASKDPVAGFWGPVWDKANPIVICVPGKFPTTETVASATGDPQRTEPITIRESLLMNSIAWPDATALYEVVGFFRSRGQAYQVRRAGDSALSDLRSGPSVLIGGLNNQWLMKLTANYRFSYRNDTLLEQAWIQDAQQPEKRDWKVAYSGPYTAFDEDYGIISRVWDPTTERVVVTASGIASYGTIAASEFLTNPKYLAMIAEHAPAGWEQKSVQVVFSTKVFNGNAGPPHILAVHVW